MKYAKLLPLLVLAGVLLTGCVWNNGFSVSTRYGSPVVMSRHTSGDIFFATDDSIHLFPLPQMTVADSMIGRRYFIDYSVSDSSNTFTYAITLHNMQLMPTDTVLKLSNDIDIDDMPDVPIEKDAIWVTGKYLNMLLYIEASGIMDHHYKLIDTGDKALKFRLMHDDLGDKHTIRLRNAISFDIQKYQEMAQSEELDIEITYNQKGSGITTTKVTIPACKPDIR